MSNSDNRVDRHDHHGRSSATHPSLAAWEGVRRPDLRYHPSPHALSRDPQLVVNEDRERLPGLRVLPPSEAVRIEAGGTLAEWMEVSCFPYFDWERLFV
jgi:hypothetical protein